MGRRHHLHSVGRLSLSRRRARRLQPSHCRLVGAPILPRPDRWQPRPGCSDVPPPTTCRHPSRAAAKRSLVSGTRLHELDNCLFANLPTKRGTGCYRVPIVDPTEDARKSLLVGKGRDARVLALVAGNGRRADRKWHGFTELPFHDHARRATDGAVRARVLRMHRRRDKRLPNQDRQQCRRFRRGSR